MISTAIPWMGDPMMYALSHVQAGVLSVDVDGRVWRHAYRAGGRWRMLGTARRAENVGGKGYLRVSLAIPGGKLAIVMAHNLVWVHHHGLISEGLQINHKNLVKSDNSLANLELVTPCGNIQHSYANGRTRPWTESRARRGDWRPGRPLLAHEIIASIRKRRRAGAYLKDIASEFGISITHAHRICAKGVP